MAVVVEYASNSFETLPFCTSEAYVILKVYFPSTWQYACYNVIIADIPGFKDNAVTKWISAPARPHNVSVNHYIICAYQNDTSGQLLFYYIHLIMYYLAVTKDTMMLMRQHNNDLHQNCIHGLHEIPEYKSWYISSKYSVNRFQKHRQYIIYNNIYMYFWVMLMKLSKEQYNQPSCC